jgi:hypothetical protein
MAAAWRERAMALTESSHIQRRFTVEGLAMMTSVGPRLPPMLDLAADAARRAAEPGLPARRPEEAEQLKPNPSLSLDPVTGMVVVEFRNLDGEVQGTVPTARQLAAYRAAALAGTPLPPGMERAAASRPEGEAAADQSGQPRRA